MPQDYNFDFPISVYSAPVKISSTISLARARIFYKGVNRNGTYISDEFAEKLISSIAFAPVKGIFDASAEDPDFTDHGAASSLGKVYGFVPKEYNFKWEDHKDPDGVTRTYATVDVILWTELYKEAKDIVGKTLSMEIYKPSITGKWALKDGLKVFEFENGEFFGLQILGNNYEPCFEGAGYFSLSNIYEAFLDLYTKLTQYSNPTTKGGLTQMPMVINFKLSDREKHDALWKALNPNFTQEGNWEVEMGINDVFDDYALCYGYEDHTFYRVYFTKSETEVTITSKEARYFLDVSEAEYNALMSLRGEDGATSYEAIGTQLTTLTSELATSQENYTHLEAEFADFKANLPQPEPPVVVDVTEYTTKITELETLNTTLTTENEALRSFKLTLENAEKKAIVDKFTALLPEDVLARYTTDDAYLAYTVEDLNSKLAVEYVNIAPNLFTHAPASQNGLIPKNDLPTGGLPALLDKYKTQPK